MKTFFKELLNGLIFLFNPPPYEPPWGDKSIQEVLHDDWRKIAEDMKKATGNDRI